MDWRRAIEDAAYATDGLRGFTCKLIIGGQDVYLKVAFLRVLEKHPTTQVDVPSWKLVHIDITLSAQKASDDILLTVRDAKAEVSKTDNARAMVELLFREVNTLLGAGVWADDDLVRAWAGTRFEPEGVCLYPALRVGEQLERHVGTVKSPLDAAAKFIQSRIVAWRRMLEAEHELVGMAADDPGRAGRGGAGSTDPPRGRGAVAGAGGADGPDEQHADGPDGRARK